MDHNNVTTTAPKPRAPPPITITDNTSVANLLKELGIKHNFKIIGVGTKIYVENLRDHTLLCNKFSELKIEFFTHPAGENRLFKLVLHGLPEIPLEEITDHLKTINNVSVHKIIMLNSNSSFKRYLLHFDPKENSKMDVKNVRSILNHLVEWLPARQIHRGPTQCLKCGMFGHGVSACYRNTKCLFCGEDHDSKSCTFDEKNNNQRIFKCHNCKQSNLPHNHKANDLQCPSRLKYIEIKSNVNRKDNRNAKPNSIPYTHTNSAFPPLPQRAPPPLTHTFAEAAKPRKQQNGHTQHASNHSSENGLFSFAEISEIMLNCVNDLARCTSKLDQLRVIANMLNNAFK